MINVKELEDQRAELIVRAEELSNAMVDSDNAADLQAEFDEVTAKAEKVDEQIQNSIARSQKLASLKNKTDRVNAPAIVNNLGDSKQEFSIRRAIEGATRQREGKSWTGFEKELADQYKVDNGAFIPFNAISRAIDTTTGAGLVASTTYPTFIDSLKAKLRFAELGGTILTGLVGNVTVPRKSSVASFGWYPEGVEPTPSSFTSGPVTLSPKACIAQYEITRKLLVSTGFDAELMAENDLIYTIKYALDQAVFVGSGSGSQPKGVVNTSGVYTTNLGTNGGPLTFGKAFELVAAVESANANDDSRGWVLSPSLMGALAVAPKATNFPSYVFENGLIAGYKALPTSVMPANLTKGTGTNLAAAIYGNWSDAILGLWNGGIQVIIDDISKVSTIKVSAIVHADVAIRQPGAFACAIDATLS